MDSNIKLTHKIKQQIGKFTGILAKNLTKPQKRFFKEMLYGIQASKDIKLSSISRSLQEEIPLIKTENRLARNLSSKDISESTNRTISHLGSSRVYENTVLALDPGEISKKYAKKMEHLCKVHDGSEGELSNGYWTCQVVGSNIDDNEIIPMYCEAYSSNAEGFTSSNTQIIKAIDIVSESVGNLGIWTIDRGGDNRKFFEKFVRENKKFCIRLRKNRNVIFKNRAYNVGAFSRKIKCKGQRKIVYNNQGKEKIRNIRYGAKKIRLPEWEHEFTLVVVKGFGKDPMLLLTTCEVIMELAESVWNIVEIYLTRWKCEETYRYIKQSYSLEDIRVRSFTAIRNIVTILIAVAYFVIIYIGKNIKMKISMEKILILSKRFFAIPAFSGYAIADGLHSLFFNCKNGIYNKKIKLKKSTDFQLSLPFY